VEKSPAKQPAEESQLDPIEPATRSDWVGSGLGIITFLLGLALLIFTFRNAAAMFSVSARETLGDQKDVTELGKSFGHVLLRIGLLLVMSVVGSLIAGQGIRLYLASRTKA
jgi:hypothetical protein